MNFDFGVIVVVIAIAVFYVRLLLIQRQRKKLLKRQQRSRSGRGKAAAAQEKSPDADSYFLRPRSTSDWLIVSLGSVLIFIGFYAYREGVGVPVIDQFWWVIAVLGVAAVGVGFK